MTINNKKKAIGICLLMLLVIFTNGCLDDPLDSREYSQFKIERILTLESESGEVDYTLSSTVPQNIKINDYDVQKVVEFESTNTHKQAQLIKTNHLYYYRGSISGQSTVTISITYNIRAYDMVWNINAENSGTIDDVPEEYRIKYTGDRWEIYDDSANIRPLPYRDIDGDGIVPDYRIAPNNPTLNSLAHHLVGNEKNVYSMAKKIYDFIDKGGSYDNVNYGWEGGGFAYPTPEQMEADHFRFFGKPKPAYVTLHDGYGDCDDQTILFITLARAVGIPAWLEAGALYNTFSANPDDRWEGHGWAKILVPMKDGKFEEPCVDPVKDLFMERIADRYSDWEDPGGERSEYLFSIASSYKTNLTDGAVVHPVLKKTFIDNGIKDLPDDAKIDKIYNANYLWKITDKNGEELYNIQDFTNEMKIYEKKPDIPESPLDIESYYTSWTYLSRGHITTIGFEEDYITHFHERSKENSSLLKQFLWLLTIIIIFSILIGIGVFILIKRKSRMREKLKSSNLQIDFRWEEDKHQHSGREAYWDQRESRRASRRRPPREKEAQWRSRAPPRGMESRRRSRRYQREEEEEKVDWGDGDDEWI